MNYLLPGCQPATKSMAQRWQQQYQQTVQEAKERQDRSVWQRLLNFGSWSLVVLDTVLLFILELGLSIPVILVAIVLFLANGNHLSGSNPDITNLQNWLSSPPALAASALATQLAILVFLEFRLVRRDLLQWRDLAPGFLQRHSSISFSSEEARVLHGAEPRVADPMQALLIGLGLGLAAFFVGEVMLYVMNAAGIDVKEQENTLKSARHANIFGFIPFAITTAITAPLAEEMFFRGYALRALTVRYGLPIGLLVSSALFALLHLAGGVGWVVAPLFVIGLILGWGYARTGNLITDVTAHVVNNSIGLILLYTS